MWDDLWSHSRTQVIMQMQPHSRREFLFSAMAGCIAARSSGSSPTGITEELFQGRHALVLQNSRMRLAVLPGGGFIADARLKSQDPSVSLNPMRVPHYSTIDPYTYDVARDAKRYGAGMQRRLVSGYMGHFTCFPHFGEGSAAEFRQDYGQHGELICVKWDRLRSSTHELLMGAHLPLTQFTFQRSVTLLPDETVCYVTETAESLVRYDRPIQWVQHSAFGPPFTALQTMFADASVSAVASGAANNRPIGDFRPFTGRTSLWLVDQNRSDAWLTVYNAQYRVLLGYLWASGPNPWLLDFQENRTATEVPWDGKTVMRGLCFGDSATSGLRNAVTQCSSFGRPTYSWMEARGIRRFRYVIFLAEIPVGFRGVSSLTAAGGQIAMVERESGRTFSVKSSLIS
jgi:hypothetical protein